MDPNSNDSFESIVKNNTGLSKKDRRMANLGMAPIGISVIYLSNWILLGLSFLGLLYGILVTGLSINPPAEGVQDFPTDISLGLGVLYISFFAAFFYLTISANRQLLLGKSLMSTLEAIIGIMVGLVLLVDPNGVTLGLILIANFSFHLYSLKFNEPTKEFLRRIA